VRGNKSVYTSFKTRGDIDRDYRQEMSEGELKEHVGMRRRNEAGCILDDYYAFTVGLSTLLELTGH
jgi:hypothetical protein